MQYNVKQAFNWRKRYNRTVALNKNKNNNANFLDQKK